MSFNSMIQQILGVPGMNRGLAATFINEAFTSIQNEGMWSFQMGTGGWLTPSLLGGMTSQLLSPGTITVTPFTNTITGDAVATAIWIQNIVNPPLLTQQQIRTPYFSLYSIIAVGFAGTVAYATVASPGSGQTPGVYTINGTGGSELGSGAQIAVTVNGDGTVTIPPIVTSPGTGYLDPNGTPDPPAFILAAGGVPATFTAQLNAVLTIDRPWMEPQQIDGPYMIYQAYYPAPVGFKRWFNFRDTTNNLMMDFWTKTQIDLANDDPQRSIFDQPYYVVPYAQDTRPGSATLGQMLYELWPHPVSQLPYTFGYQANWPALSSTNYSVPYPLTEETIKWRTYEVVYQWKESQKGDDMERGSGANWQFLAQAAAKEYGKQLKLCRNMDRNLVELYFTKARMAPPYGGEPFATVNGLVNVGSF